MALKNDRLLIPRDGGWVEYSALDEHYTIKNNSNVIVEYKYNDTDGVSHKLGLKETIIAINQKIFIRNIDVVSVDVWLEITKGVQKTVMIANFTNGIGAEWAIKLDSWGLQKFSKDYRIWRDTFYSGISQKVWNITKTDGFTKAVQGSGQFSSGSTVGSYLTCYSKQHSRYQPNSGILISTACSIPNPKTVGGIRRWGAATIEDGYFFEISDDGICYVVVRQSDFENIDAADGQTVFPFEYDIISTSTVYVRVKYADKVLWEDITDDIESIDYITNEVTMTTPLSLGDEICIVSVNDLKNEISTNLQAEGIDLSKQVLFDIQAQWRGAGDVTFIVRSASVEGISTGISVTYNNLGQNERANISNPALSAFVECKNVSADGIDFKLKIGCINIAAEGGQDDVAEYVSVVSPNQPDIKVGDTTDDEVFLMIAHAPLFYNGRHNTRDMETVRTSAWSDQKSHMNIYTTKNPLFLTGGLLLKERSEFSSVLFDNNLNADNTTARNDEVDLSTLEIATRARVQIDNTQTIIKPCDGIEFVLTAGDYMIVTGQRELASGNANMGASIEIGERT